MSTKINYGIDLGTTNSAIAVMQDGEPVIIRTDSNKDTMPSCVAINKKKVILVGDPALNYYKRERQSSKSINEQFNSFIEFKRTMGTDKKYYSPNAGREFTSEELSAEVLKKLKSFVKQNQPKAVIITVPAAFKMNQIDATRRAAQLAGFEYVEILQEPIAAAMAYGIKKKVDSGYWVVFDLGGGTFDAALLNVQEGIVKVVDTQGDNYLGGKNMDYAVVDKILIPYLKENYALDLDNNPDKLAYLREILKFWAEEVKNQLTFSETYNLYIEAGQLGTDDQGEEIEIDITVDRDTLREVISPVIQRAIDLTKQVLERNNLTIDQIDRLILVGGPTQSPILQQMLTEQLKQPDVSADPMTVVARGAAIYASTIDMPQELIDIQTSDSLIKLDLTYESTTVEPEEIVAIKPIVREGEQLPSPLYIEIVRGDKGWASGKVELPPEGTVIDLALQEHHNNIFHINLYDQFGNKLDVFPQSFSIIHGTKIMEAPLPFNIGIEVYDQLLQRHVFRTVKGLEKNKPLPAKGMLFSLKVPKDIRPGNAEDIIRIPIYQGEHDAEGSRAIYNEHVSDVVISGLDVKDFIPKNSELDLTIEVDRSQKMKVTVYFHAIDDEYQAIVDSSNVDKIDEQWLKEQIGLLRERIESLKEHINLEQYNAYLQQYKEIEEIFLSNPKDLDTRRQVLGKLRELLRKIDKYIENIEMPKLIQDAEILLSELTLLAIDKGNAEIIQPLLKRYLKEIEEAKQNNDKHMLRRIIDNLKYTIYKTNERAVILSFLYHIESNFNTIKWKDRNQALSLLNNAKKIIAASDGENIEALRPIVNRLAELGDLQEKEYIGSEKPGHTVMQ